jgi:hypothetical protein
MNSSTPEGPQSFLGFKTSDLDHQDTASIIGGMMRFLGALLLFASFMAGIWMAE